MTGPKSDPFMLLQQLDDTIEEAAAYLAETDESLFDGHQTAREMLSHLVFWHREYLQIAEALAAERNPALKRGTFAELNAEAVDEFSSLSMKELAHCLLTYHESLTAALSRVPDWDVSFPIKHSSRQKNVVRRLKMIEAHVRAHVTKLQRAERLGDEWVRAYYLELD